MRCVVGSRLAKSEIKIRFLFLRKCNELRCAVWSFPPPTDIDLAKLKMPKPNFGNPMKKPTARKNKTKICVLANTARPDATACCNPPPRESTSHSVLRRYSALQPPPRESTGRVSRPATACCGATARCNRHRVSRLAARATARCSPPQRDAAATACGSPPKRATAATARVDKPPRAAARHSVSRQATALRQPAPSASRQSHSVAVAVNVDRSGVSPSL
jgi:hypothetical protein